MSDGVEINHHKDDFENPFFRLLKSMEEDADEIIVVVKSGGACSGRSRAHSEDVELEHRRRKPFCCCRHRGILCNVTRDFIVLIGDRRKIFIPINAIAAIIEDDKKCRRC